MTKEVSDRIYNAKNRLDLNRTSLFVDADGTLLDIASRPEDARASPFLLDTLRRLYGALDGALAVVTGRRIEDLDRLLAPLVLPASGVHGAQIRRSTAGAIVDSPAPDIPERLRDAISILVARYPGAFVEDKGKALAVHWRSAPDREADIWTDVTAALEAAGDPELTILRGHCVFEVKSAATTKGDAVRAFMQIAPYAGRTPLFVGDDVTDLAGFAAAKALGGRAFSVGGLLEGADGAFAGPAEVRAWLADLAAPAEARRA